MLVLCIDVSFEVKTIWLNLFGIVVLRKLNASIISFSVSPFMIDCIIGNWLQCILCACHITRRVYHTLQSVDFLAAVVVRLDDVLRRVKTILQRLGLTALIELKKQFASVDTTGSGTLTLPQLSSAFQSFGISLSDAVRRVFIPSLQRISNCALAVEPCIFICYDIIFHVLHVSTDSFHFHCYCILFSCLPRLLEMISC